jgi:hypothetical protein
MLVSHRHVTITKVVGLEGLERETGIEPATNGLGSRYSTIELLPPRIEIIRRLLTAEAASFGGRTKLTGLVSQQVAQPMASTRIGNGAPSSAGNF